MELDSVGRDVLMRTEGGVQKAGWGDWGGGGGGGGGQGSLIGVLTPMLSTRHTDSVVAGRKYK